MKRLDIFAGFFMYFLRCRNRCHVHFLSYLLNFSVGDIYHEPFLSHYFAAAIDLLIH
ncbi:Uncharacterised protein [Candidatus Venteria ishoeyi]|uniref:Uncharacterized protein n=1 Tax=Candidatus Venteria ishoeyi TaxID=1899563 RepID=A0A1H6FA01_9GAMM|nr:Uncharacterised protein [Candidatus Venteria ishoeyi]